MPLSLPLRRSPSYEPITRIELTVEFYPVCLPLRAAREVGFPRSPFQQSGFCRCKLPRLWYSDGERRAKVEELDVSDR